MPAFDRRPPRDIDTLRYEGPKQYALLKPDIGATMIHISEAQLKRTYYHPCSLEPLNARINHQTPHFYYKKARTESNSAFRQDEPTLDNFENEGIAHILAIRAIVGLKAIKMQLGSGPNAEKYTIHFKEVNSKREGVRTPKGDLIYPDIVATISSPDNIRQQFGGKLYIEVASHNELNDHRISAYRSMPHGAIEIKLDWRTEHFEKLEREAKKYQQVIPSEQIKQWEGTMKKMLLFNHWPNFTHDPHWKLRPRQEDNGSQTPLVEVAMPGSMRLAQSPLPSASDTPRQLDNSAKDAFPTLGQIESTPLPEFSVQQPDHLGNSTHPQQGLWRRILRELRNLF